VGDGVVEQKLGLLHLLAVHLVGVLVGPRLRGQLCLALAEQGGDVIVLLKPVQDDAEVGLHVQQQYNTLC